MKREGYIHGAVVRATPRAVKRAADGVAAAKPASPAPASRQTSESKFTGKCKRPRCNGCHMCPPTKAKGKAKGAHKERDGDVALNHRLASWRARDGGIAPDVFEGAPATDVLRYLAGSVHSSFHDEQYADGHVGVYGQETVSAAAAADVLRFLAASVHGSIQEDDTGDVYVQETVSAVSGGGDREEEMDFCMVGFVMETTDGDDWLLVEEI